MKSTYIEHPTQVAIVAWDDMDLTDFTGPIEVLSHARNSSQERLVKCTIVSSSESVQTSQGVRIIRDVDTETFLTRIAEFDIFILPGGGGFTAESFPTAPGVRETLKALTALPARSQDPRVLMSICAGAYFLAEAGLLAGKAATTHYGSLEGLRTVGEKHGEIRVIRQHYVDAGKTPSGLHIITSGGITSGFDSTLYLLEQRFGPEVAERSRAIMDATWRKEVTPFA